MSAKRTDYPAKPTTQKGERRRPRVVRVTEYDGGWQVHLMIGDPDGNVLHRRSAKLEPKEALKLGKHLIAAAKRAHRNTKSS
jgi:hypothetical protein